MGRKKELFAYKEGMKNGAKPFEKKFEEIQNQEEEISRISNDIKRNQTRLRELTDKLITEEEKNSENVADLKKETEDITKKSKRSKKSLIVLKMRFQITETAAMCAEILLKEVKLCARFAERLQTTCPMICKSLALNTNK